MIIFWLTFNFNFLLCKIAQIATEWTKALILRFFGNIDFDGYCSWLFYVKCGSKITTSVLLLRASQTLTDLSLAATHWTFPFDY